MKEIIQKLKELTDVEIDGQNNFNNNFTQLTDTVEGLVNAESASFTQIENNYLGLVSAFKGGFEALRKTIISTSEEESVTLDGETAQRTDLVSAFKDGFEALRNAIISTSAKESAQRMSLALRAEERAETEAARRRLAEREARQEAADSRRLQMLGSGALSKYPSKARIRPDLGMSFADSVLNLGGNVISELIAAMTAALFLDRKRFLRNTKAFFLKSSRKFKAFRLAASRFIGAALRFISLFVALFEGGRAFIDTEGSFTDKAIAGIKEYFKTFVGFLYGFALDLAKNLLVGLAGLLGAPEEMLEGIRAFSITDFLEDIVESLFKGLDVFFTSIFDGMFEGIAANVDKGFFKQLIGGLQGLITGWIQGLLGSATEVIDTIAGSFGVDLPISFKEFINLLAGQIWETTTGVFKEFLLKKVRIGQAFVRANIFIGEWIVGYAKDIWGTITGFFTSIIDTAKEEIASIGEGMISISDAVKKFIRDMLPEEDSFAGKIIAPTGLYESLGSDTSLEESDSPTFVDTTAIIPPKSSVGEALTQVGTMTGGGSVTVVNNNGGNVTNTTTSNQTNNTSTASPPVLSGSALALATPGGM